MAGVDPSRVMCYIDDIVICGRTFDEHLSFMDIALRRLQHVGLACKFRKCELFMRKVHDLGHIVGHNALGRDARIVDKANVWSYPKDATAVREFPGCLGFYQDFIPLYAAA